MMNKFDRANLQKLKAAKLNYIIAGSYILKSRPNDIDILVKNRREFKKVMKALPGGSVSKTKRGDKVYTVGNIEIYDKWYPRKYKYKKIKYTKKDGHRVWTKEEAIRWKHDMGRPKDIRYLKK